MRAAGDGGELYALIEEWLADPERRPLTPRQQEMLKRHIEELRRDLPDADAHGVLF